MEDIDLYLYSNLSASLLYVESPEPPTGISIDRTPVVPYRTRRLGDGRWQTILPADGLQPWSPDSPALHVFAAEGVGPFRFGHCELATLNNSHILLNGCPVFLRGYIRGIVAHDHPNLEGLDELEFHRRNIRQAKRFGFNLVRFHSTVPDELFVQAADELGLLIHAEIGFAYEQGRDGGRTLSLDNRAWTETIRKYRNHPSLAIFCIGNEMHNAGRIPQVMELYRQGKALASHKLIMDNSGWGEYDRTSADVFSQHIAYFLPFKRHRDMFTSDACWHQNGSVSGLPMAEEGRFRRHANPLRPVLSHEAVHYIEIIDYEALDRKFDERTRIDVRKPRFLTELPRLIRRKRLEGRLPDYIAASRRFKMICLKLYLERQRLSSLCGFEMLQLADCFKYENRNGIIDCFDEDKFITPEWMRRINGDSVLLIDRPEESFAVGSRPVLPVFLSHFSRPANTAGELTVLLDRRRLFSIPRIATVSGLQKLADVEFEIRPGRQELALSFATPEQTVENSWEFWGYEDRPAPEPGPGLSVADRLDDRLFELLRDGRTVLLNYHRDNPGNQYYWPGALDRFKPCIWDRGSNLGGIVNEDWLLPVFGERYFNLNVQPLVEGAYKLNLDRFPAPGREFISGVDKPVRDRMKGLVDNVKDFLDDDTLRNFCYLFGIRVGPGTLFVSTLNRNDSLIGRDYRRLLLATLPTLRIQQAIEPETLRKYLADATAKGPLKEDVMNHFWELDDKMVEDVLFWESCGLDLGKIR